MLKKFSPLALAAITTVILLSACNSKNVALTKLQLPERQHFLQLNIAEKKLWQQSQIANEFSSMQMISNLDGSDERIAFSWYPVDNIADFLNMAQENANLRKRETGCLWQLTTLHQDDNSMLYRESESSCQHKAGVFQSIGKVFIGEDGVYSVSFSHPKANNPSKNDDFMRQVIEKAELLKND